MVVCGVDIVIEVLPAENDVANDATRIRKEADVRGILDFSAVDGDGAAAICARTGRNKDALISVMEINGSVVDFYGGSRVYRTRI